MADTHSDLIKRCLLRLSGRGVLCWDNQSGALPVGDRFISFGLKGSSDILGVACDGRFIGVECKTGTGRQSKAQKRFQHAVEMRGGLYVVARSPEDTDVVPGWDEARVG